MSRFKKILPFLLTVFLFFLIYLASRNIPQEILQRAIRQSGVWGSLIFIIFYWSTALIAPLSGSPILFAGYFAFGSKVIFLASFAGAISFITNFWIARRFGREIVSKFVGQEATTKIDKLTQNYGLLALFFLRFFQGGIGDFVSYAAGLTTLKFWSYFFVSLLASLPGTVLWYFLTEKVNTPVAFTLLTLGMAGFFSLLFILGSFIFTRLRKLTK